MHVMWEHFEHGADIGVRGFGDTLPAAFEQAALAMTAVVADPESIEPRDDVQIECSAPDQELLLVDWLNNRVDELSEYATAPMLSTLIDFKRPLAVVPSLAIHLDREANEKRHINRQTMLPPVVSLAAGANRSVALDASVLSSGTYVYRVTARMKDTVETGTGRMVLVK